MNNFELWLEQPVTFSAGMTMSRKEVIPDFTRSLDAFIRKFGYKFGNTWSAKTVARWLYTIHIREATGDTSLFPYEEPLHRNTFEDRAHFDCLISEDEIDSLFSAWNDCSDLSVDTDIGSVIRHEVLRFLWNYIDLDTSYQGQYMAEILFPESDSESESEKQSDHYMKDSSAGYHG
jgi:hypothetical protein